MDCFGPGQPQSQGPDSLIGNATATLFGTNKTQQEQREIRMNLCEQSKTSLQNSAEPDGQQESPAKTCRDLFVSYPEKSDGDYWIDPNGGDVSDAILVGCYVENRTTCIKPEQTESLIITITSNEQEFWLSEIKSGMQITYGASSHQINALQLSSSYAEQKITYHCENSIGYFDAKGQTYERGMKLLAWNDVVLTPRGRQRFRYDMILDECQDRPNDWGKTEIIYRTDRPVRLPIVDVALRDVGKPDQRGVVGIGDVCFR